MSQLSDFYLQDGYDSEGRSLGKILSYSDNELEGSHDVVQWLFPLNETSNFNADAPILTDDDITHFKRSGELQDNFENAYWRFMKFLGFQMGKELGILDYRENFSERAKVVWAEFNHNMLRITRILKSCKLLGHDEKADMLYAKCKEIYESGKYNIPAETFKYWTEAVNVSNEERRDTD